MRRNRSTRILASFVALLFFAGEAGTSGLDALLFHGAAAPAAAAAHFEAAGTSNHHADNCLLTLRLASSRGAPPLGFAIRFEGIPQHAAAPLPVAAPQSFDPGLHQDSRAPPAALA